MITFRFMSVVFGVTNAPSLRVSLRYGCCVRMAALACCVLIGSLALPAQSSAPVARIVNAHKAIPHTVLIRAPNNKGCKRKSI